MPDAFASDNYAGIHPAVLAAIEAANHGHVPSYGHDPITERAVERLREVLEAPAAEVAFVFNGTGANVVGLMGVLRPWEAVICPASAHINVDECGAPERIAGAKLLPVATPDGKLTPELLVAQVKRMGDEHYAQARIVSVSQPTEYGTVYAPQELRELVEVAHGHGLLVHLDGARLGNAVASVGADPAALTSAAGVDLLSFGGTKSGLMFGEAVVVLTPGLAAGLPFLRKQAGQLASKMRFLAAQFEALLSDDLWLELARHSNALARRLAGLAVGVAGVEVTQAVQANAVFARLPREAIAPLQARHAFYVWDEATAEVRWMVAFDHSEADVDRFGAALAEEVGAARP